jgi:hypothetical protein
MMINKLGSSFQELDTETNAVVVVLGCEPAELRLLLTFMYTGEVTASKKVLPSLLRLAQTLKVSGLTDADTVSFLLIILLAVRPSFARVQC